MEKSCKNCGRFKRHYYKMSLSYIHLNCGHCILNNESKTENDACKQFKIKKGEETLFLKNYARITYKKIISNIEDLLNHFKNN